jgi:DNA-binding transcriptional LysR family regulator
MRLRIRQLEALSSVAEHGSMTRAARDLGVSQPAVSRLLADLSGQLGFRLFDRRGTRLVPTQEARFLLPDIHRLIERLDLIGEVSRNLTDGTAGHLRIACLPGFATSHLPGVLARFLAERPGVTVTLEPDRPERIMAWIVGEQFDCAITDGFDGYPAVSVEHVTVRTVCVFPTGHRLAARAVIAPADLHGERLIHTRRDSPFYRDLAEALRGAGADPDGRVETRQFTAACELVSLGLGVAVVSEHDAVGYAHRGLDYRRFVPALPYRLSLVRPEQKTPSLIALEFLSMFRESLLPYRHPAEAAGRAQQHTGTG